MEILSNKTFNDIYFLNSQTNIQQLTNTINACLCKAEALATIAATIDFEAYTAETINNYFWALSDIVREAKYLHSECTNNSSGKM